jgi:hypothetical protein
VTDWLLSDILRCDGAIRNGASNYYPAVCAHIPHFRGRNCGTHVSLNFSPALEPWQLVLGMCGRFHALFVTRSCVRVCAECLRTQPRSCHRYSANPSPEPTHPPQHRNPTDPSVLCRGLLLESHRMKIPLASSRVDLVAENAYWSLPHLSVHIATSPTSAASREHFTDFRRSVSGTDWAGNRTDSLSGLGCACNPPPSVTLDVTWETGGEIGKKTVSGSVCPTTIQCVYWQARCPKT